MKQLKTALFDFDGVVVDTEPITIYSGTMPLNVMA